MKTHQLLNSTIALAVFVSTSGCASIMSGSRKNVSIKSNPTGAHVTVADKKGREVASLTTPCVANLKRSAGFFVGASYDATIEKQGYQSQRVHISATGNPWTMGNLVFGGLVGLLIVDPATGGMFGLTPSEINANLVPASKQSESAKPIPSHRKLTQR